ncbi:MAG: IclR family transcriptional regulator [Desulfuromonadaceae bacterium]|nr:IclR family transcriptional regulator [Desulfuromonadaceae bacterium]MDD5104968.1 IclR family transcriptional regulator [Desulfuromonadaceae bacterium]
MTNYNIQTVTRALDVLEQFVEIDMELGLTDLSSRLKLQKNNVFRLIATLKARNYLEINDLTGKYRLGMKTSLLGMAATRQNDIISQARPILHKLKILCRENCYLSVKKEFHSYYLDGVESDLPVRAAHRIGSSLPLHATAAGKVHLAFLGQEEMNLLIHDMELKRFTPHTITDSETLRSELNKIVQQGYAIEDQEHDIGVMEIAAPVFGGNGAIVGSLCISGPAMRLAGGLLVNDLILLLQSEATQFSDSLGRPRKQPENFATPLQNTKSRRTGRAVIRKPSVALH